MEEEEEEEGLGIPKNPKWQLRERERARRGREYQ